MNLSQVELRELEPTLVGDFLDFFDRDAFSDNSSGASCYCSYFHWSGDDDSEWVSRTAQTNRASKAALIERGQASGVLAHLDGRPIGWCHAASKRSLAHLVALDALASPDDEAVGSIVCFVVAKPFRGTGVSSLLLEGACEVLTKRGLRVAEAYPDRDAADDYRNFHGRLRMFVDAGFHVHRELSGDMAGIVIVRRDLDANALD